MKAICSLHPAMDLPPHPTSIYSIYHCQCKLPELNVCHIILNLKLIRCLKDEAGISEPSIKTKIPFILMIFSLLWIYFRNLILKTINLLMVYLETFLFSISIHVLIFFLPFIKNRTKKLCVYHVLPITYHYVRHKISLQHIPRIEDWIGLTTLSLICLGNALPSVSVPIIPFSSTSVSIVLLRTVKKLTQ